MRWLVVATALAVLSGNAMAADAPKPKAIVAPPTAASANLSFMAPSLAGGDSGISPADVGAPAGQTMSAPRIGLPATVMGPASMAAPEVLGGSGALDAFQVDPQSVSPALPTTKPAPMASPQVSAPPSVTVPPLEPMSAGAPRITTQEDVAASIAKMKRDKDAQRQAAMHRGQHAPAASPAAAQAVAGAAAPGGIDTGGINGAGARAETAVPIPVPVPVPVAVPVLTAGPPDRDACGSGGDIAQLLSPSCLDSLRYVRNGPSAPAAAAPAAVANGTQCTMVIFGATGAAAPVSFMSASAEQCLAVATRMSYGVPGTSNITAVDPAMGLVAVSCKRPGPEATTIECAAQE